MSHSILKTDIPLLLRNQISDLTLYSISQGTLAIPMWSDAGPGDKVCYYYGPKQAVYEELGHAEVVQMERRGESAQTRRQMEAFADTYFGQFRKTPFGMMRLDPQDAGPAYRNVIGIPKGVDSPLFQVLKVLAFHCCG